MKHRTALLFVPLLLALFAIPAVAQDPAMEAMARAGQPGEMHEILGKMTGQWTLNVKMWMGPQAAETTGSMEARLVMDGRFVEGVVNSSLNGQPFKGHWFAGYNNVTGEFESIWMDNMNSAMPRMTGSLNEAGDVLTFKGKYKDPATGAWIDMWSTMKFVSPTEIHETSYEKRDGNDVKIMEIRYTKR